MHPWSRSWVNGRADMWWQGLFPMLSQAKEQESPECTHTGRRRGPCPSVRSPWQTQRKTSSMCFFAHLLESQNRILWESGGNHPPQSSAPCSAAWIRRNRPEQPNSSTISLLCLPPKGRLQTFSSCSISGSRNIPGAGGMSSNYVWWRQKQGHTGPSSSCQLWLQVLCQQPGGEGVELVQIQLPPSFGDRRTYLSPSTRHWTFSLFSPFLSLTSIKWFVSSRTDSYFFFYYWATYGIASFAGWWTDLQYFLDLVALVASFSLHFRMEEKKEGRLKELAKLHPISHLPVGDQIRLCPVPMGRGHTQSWIRGAVCPWWKGPIQPDQSPREGEPDQSPLLGNDLSFSCLYEMCDSEKKPSKCVLSDTRQHHGARAGDCSPEEPSVACSETEVLSTLQATFINHSGWEGHLSTSKNKRSHLISTSCVISTLYSSPSLKLPKTFRVNIVLHFKDEKIEGKEVKQSKCLPVHWHILYLTVLHLDGIPVGSGYISFMTVRTRLLSCLFVFLGPHLRHMEVPKPGVKVEL